MFKFMQHILFIIIILQLLHLPPSSSAEPPLRVKPGCPERCGNLTIPYPFGIGPGCFMELEPSFEIHCDNSTDTPKAYIFGMNKTRVIEINDEEVRVKFPNLALSSYPSGGNISIAPYDLSGTRYMFSDDNWLTAIGCDDMVSVTGTVTDPVTRKAKRSFGGGCVSYCPNKTSAAECPTEDNGFGLGPGCCHCPLPKGTTNLTVKLTDVYDNWRDSKLFSSSFAFIGDKKSWTTENHTYPLSDLDRPTTFSSIDWVDSNIPSVLLDWTIGPQKCPPEFDNLTTYACQANTECRNFDDKSSNVGGYLCMCKTGYDGNAYLPPGCQDIDECKNETSPCHRNEICTNTQGSHNCTCKLGYMKGSEKECTLISHDRRPPYQLIYALAGVGAGLGFILVVLAIFSRLRKLLQERKKSKSKERMFRNLLSQYHSNDETTCPLQRTKLFHAKEMEKATNRFSKERILGQGAQGTVFKGMLSDGNIVAIKKLKFVQDDQLEPLINEVVILSQINHRNVVKLLGCCLATEAPLLVYEFVPNGTLFDLLHDPKVEFPFTWSIRLKIATDIAGALAYLHSASTVPIYHRDIKSSNILLDEKFVVKVSDFGTSKVVAVDQTHLTTMVRGTFGYLDPEYFLSSQFTDKSDVYSFGVVLAELLTGKRPISLNRSGNNDDANLSALLLESMEANNLGAILDARVCKADEKEQVVGVARLAVRCLNPKGKVRPTMREVATELEGIRMCSSSKDECEEAIAFGSFRVSDNEYTWSGNGKSEMTSLPLSDASPFILEEL